MTDQAAELRQRMRRFVAEQATAARQPYVLAVLGARPDVGATTLAVRLASEFARQGHATTLVDADPAGGSVESHCGKLESAAHNLADVLTARTTIHAALRRGPSGLQVIGGVGAALRSSDWTEVSTERLHAAIRQLGGHAKCVVLDAGSASTPAAVRNCRHANHVLLVATADESALMEIYATLKQLHNERPMLPLSLVVNRATDDAAQAIHRRLAETVRRFLGRQIGLAAVVPDDAGTAAPEPACAIERLAARLADEVGWIPSCASIQQPVEHVA